VGPRAGLDVCGKFRRHQHFFFVRILYFIVLVLDFQRSFVSYFIVLGLPPYGGNSTTCVLKIQ
jgi:hypothetical protein